MVLNCMDLAFPVVYDSLGTLDLLCLGLADVFEASMKFWFRRQQR